MKDILYGLGAVLLLALAVIWGLALALAGPAEILHSVSVWVKEAAGMKLSKFANLVKNAEAGAPYSMWREAVFGFLPARRSTGRRSCRT